MAAAVPHATLLAKWKAKMMEYTPNWKGPAQRNHGQDEYFSYGREMWDPIVKARKVIQLYSYTELSKKKNTLAYGDA